MYNSLSAVIPTDDNNNTIDTGTLYTSIINLAKTLSALNVQ